MTLTFTRKINLVVLIDSGCNAPLAITALVEFDFDKYVQRCDQYQNLFSQLTTGYGELLALENTLGNEVNQLIELTGQLEHHIEDELMIARVAEVAQTTHLTNQATDQAKQAAGATVSSIPASRWPRKPPSCSNSAPASSSAEPSRPKLSIRKPQPPITP